MNRRSLLIGGAIGAVGLGCPALLRAQVASGTPVVDGKRVRRKLSSLSDDDAFFAAYARAIELMHQQPETSRLSWLAQARTHADFCAHGTLEFFPWHRPYLVLFEHICGALIEDPDFALPYWDWGDNAGRLPQPFFDEGPLNVLSWSDDGNYIGQSWGSISTVPYRFARADFGLADDPRVAGGFTPEALAAILDARDFSLLSGLAEGPHGTVHVFTGGDPQFDLGTDRGHFRDGLSPLDPCFWLHHANVDRLWAQSAISIDDQKAAFDDLSKVYAGMFFDENEQPVSPVLGDLFDLAGQDFTYDFLVPEEMSPEYRAVQEQIAAAQEELRAFADASGIAMASPGAAPEVIARGEGAAESVVGAINRIDLSAETIPELITTERLVPRRSALVEGALAIDTARIYAHFKGVQPQAASAGNLLNVFVNCPYLSELTPTTDPHFAGSLSFFGCNPEVCGPRDFVVDITGPLRFLLETGALTPSEIQLQLLSLGDGDLAGQPVAQHGEVELLTA